MLSRRFSDDFGACKPIDDWSMNARASTGARHNGRHLFVGSRHITTFAQRAHARLIGHRLRNQSWHARLEEINLLADKRREVARRTRGVL